jgi:L-ascorbate metabolism protein UlaG (beta-lactamase superfamily)
MLLPLSTERGSHSRTASPLPAVMDPDQAALAAELLQAERLVPISYGGYTLPGLYEPVTDALKRLKSASNRVTTLGLGESIKT